MAEGSQGWTLSGDDIKYYQRITVTLMKTAEAKEKPDQITNA